MSSQESETKNDINYHLDEILEYLGFSEVEYNLDYSDVCENCGTKPDRLFFGMRSYWDSREGVYWCADCILDRHKDNQKYIRKMDDWFNNEFQTESELNGPADG